LLRIIAGEFRGRRIRVPPVEGLRPTGERVREALFSILGERLSAARVLDAYAGSGALGLEALSRGAAHVTFVEADPRAVEEIERNVATLAVAARCRVVRGRVLDLLGRATLSGPFDLILADPPWQAGEGRPLLARIGTAGVVAPDGLVVVERAARDEPPPAEPLRLVRSARYGDTALDFFSP
jgi:16S rRNA (guanine966-N2)-methyltransferase